MWENRLFLLVIPLAILMLINYMFYKTNWKYSGWFSLFCAYICVAFLGFVYYNLHLTKEIVLPNSKQTYLLEVEDSIEISSHNKAFKTQVLKTMCDSVLMDGLYGDTNSKLLLYLSINDTQRMVKKGDSLVVCARVRSYDENHIPDAFSRRTYYAKKNIRGWLYAFDNSWYYFGDTVISYTKDQSLIKLCKQWCDRRLNSLDLPQQELGFLKSILLAERNEMDKSRVDQFRVVGLAHLLAISGLHIGLIYSFLLLIFQVRFHHDWKDWIKQLVILFCVWMYVIMIGSPISSTRVVIMLSLIHVYRLFVESQWSSLHLLWLTAFFLVLLQPTTLFDLSFQFSFLAVFGLLTFIPKCTSWFSFYSKNFKKKHPNRFVLRRMLFDFVCVTLVAQAFVSPLSIYYFHYFSTYFLLSALLLPLFSVILYSGILLLLPIPYLSQFLVLVVSKLIYLLFKCNEIISQLPYARLYVWWNIYDVFIAYFVLFAVYSLFFIVRRSHKLKVVYILVFGVICLGFYSRYLQYHLLKSSETLVYIQGNTLSVNYVDECHNAVITNDSTQLLYNDFKLHWLHRNAIYPTFYVTDSVANYYVYYLHRFNIH